MSRLTRRIKNATLVKHFNGFTSICYDCDHIGAERCYRCGFYDAIEKLADMEDEAEGRNGMTNYERIKQMSVEEIAEKIINLNITDEYCKSTCTEEDLELIRCTDEKELKCCIEWLKEEVV